MFTSISRFKKRPLYAFAARTLVSVLSCALVLGPSAAQAQGAFSFYLPAPGTMLSTTAAFMPALVRGMTIHPENPLKFDFLIDQGDDLIPADRKRDEYQTLIKYFLTSLTVPEEDLWVNLNPDEPDRIIPGKFGLTAMGRDLLAQDYILKQLTASLIYPEGELGEKFWEKIYRIARERYGSAEVPINMFNKVWIVPDTAVVFEQGNTAYVADARLRVMLEVDYKSREASFVKREAEESPRDTLHEIRDTNVSNAIIRDIIIPELEKEVNEGRHFAQLRQIYNSLILAAWYKQNLKESILGQVYFDQNKISGVDAQDKEAKQKIYAQYMQAFEQGVYNYIKEDVDPVTREVIPRKYFSGGTELPVSKYLIRSTDFNALPLEARENIAELPHRLPAEGKGSSPVEIAEVDLLEFRDEDRAAAGRLSSRSSAFGLQSEEDEWLADSRTPITQASSSPINKGEEEWLINGLDKLMPQAKQQVLMNLGIRKVDLARAVMSFRSLAGLDMNRVLNDLTKELGIERERAAKAVVSFPPLAGLDMNRVLNDLTRELGIEWGRAAKAVVSFPQLAGLSVKGNLQPKMEVIRRIGVSKEDEIGSLIALAPYNVKVIEIIEQIAATNEIQLKDGRYIRNIAKKLDFALKKGTSKTAAAWVKADEESIEKIIKPELVRIMSAEPSASSPVEEKSGRRVVLVVDDYPSILTSSGRYLRSYGFEVLTAENGRQALEVMEKQIQAGKTIDWIITDNNMPEMAGPEFVRNVKGRYPGIPIYMITGDIEDVKVLSQALNIPVYGKTLSFTEIIRQFNEEHPDRTEGGSSSPVTETNGQPLLGLDEFKARRFDSADYAVVEFTPQKSREERLRQRRAAGVTVEASLNSRRLLKKFWSVFTPTPLVQKPGINAFARKLFGTDRDIEIWIKNETVTPTGSYKDRAPVEFFRRVEVELERIENEPVDINREEQEPFRILDKSVSTGNHGKAVVGAANAANRYVAQWGLSDRFDLKAEVTLGINAMEHKVKAIRDAGGIVRQHYDEQKTKPIPDYFSAENLVFAELDPASALYNEYFMQIRHADPGVVSSYSGIAHEIIEQLTEAGVHLSQLRNGEMNVAVPFGSGGLTAGMSELHALFDTVNVFGVTAPETSMSFRSFEENRIIREPDPNPDREVLTDGNRATPEPFALARIAEFARAVMLITEQDALYATALLYLNGIIVEPTSGLALALAFIDQEYFDPAKLKHIVIPLTSRNISDKMREETQRVAALGEEHILAYFQDRRAQVRAAKEEGKGKTTASSPVEARQVGDLDKGMADELTRYIKGYVAEMIYEANHAERTPNKVGGHLAAPLSSLENMMAVHLFVKKGSDHVADKPHASPVLHAIQYLLGELPEEAMHRFRENRTSPPTDTDADMVYPYLSADQRRQFDQFVEKALATFPESAKPQYDDLEGLHAYPGMADRDYVTIPSGSVGLGPAAAIGLALMHKWLQQRGIVVPDAHFFAIIGDAESEIGNLQEILSIASEYDLDNVTFIIDDNRQSLDETVDNRKGLQMLERFRANAWEVIDLKWGTRIADIFDNTAGGGEFKALMTALANREYQELLRLPAEGVRAFLEDKAVQYQIPAGKLKELFDTKTDGELFRIIRDLAGHDLPLLVEQYSQARERKNGRPRVYRTLTIKGNDVKFLEGNERNHGQLPTAKEMAVLREQWGIEPGNPYRKPDMNSDAAEFLRTTAARLSREREQAEQIKESNRNKFNEQIADSLKRFPSKFSTGYLSPSTQAYLGNMIARLERIHDTPVEELEGDHKLLKPFADLFATIAPDVASSTEQDFQMRDVDRRYNPEHTAGNHFQVGIREMTAMSITGAFGKSREFTGMPTFPILTTYDPFLFRRALDMLFYNAYWGARFIMRGTPSGSSLSAEGAQHQSFLSMLIASALPNVIAWDPAFVLEEEIILADAFKRAATDDDAGRKVVFIRANNLAYRLHQDKLIEHLRAQARYQGKEDELILKEWKMDVLSGGYSLTDHRGDAGYQPGKNAVNIFTAGAMAHEAMIVHDLLLEKGIFANIHVVTSPNLLVGRLGVRNGHRQLRRLIPENERSHDLASLVPVLTDVDAAPYLQAIGDILELGLGVKHLALEKFGLSTRQPERIHRHHGISQEDLIKEVLAQLALNTMDINDVNEKGKDVIKGELRALLTGDYALSKAFIEKFGDRDMLLDHVLGLVGRYEGPLEGLGQYVFDEMINPRRAMTIIEVTHSPMQKVAQDMQDFIDRHTLPLIEHLNAVNRIKTGATSSPVQDQVGGIDLNPAQLKLQIKRDGRGVPLPVNLQPIETLHIDGFVPVIINITPVLSLPLLSEAIQLSPPYKHAGKEDEYRPSPIAYRDQEWLSAN